MVILLFILQLFSAHAGEGSVVVLEAPLFREPNRDSKVVQYLRRNQKVYVHPSFTQTNDFDDSEFIKVKDHQGRDAWMIREHLHVWFEDPREWAQKDPNPDKTDYRLYEPLPDTYPFVHKQTLRAGGSFSLATTSGQNYPYQEKIRAQALGFPLEFNAYYMRHLPKADQGRWFVGGAFSIRAAISNYTLESRTAEEEWLRVGGGGVLSYDAWRTEGARITLSWSALLYPYSRANITQTDDGRSESRVYTGWNFGSRLGGTWQKIHFLGEIDLVVGAWAEFETPYRMTTSDSTREPTWWKAGKNDSFNAIPQVSFAGTIGLQSAY